MGLENRSTVSVYKRLQVRNNILCGTFLLCRSVHKDSSNNMNLYLVTCLIVAASYKTEGCCTPGQWEGKIGEIGGVARKSFYRPPQLIGVSFFHVFLYFTFAAVICNLHWRIQRER